MPAKFIGIGDSHLTTRSLYESIGLADELLTFYPILRTSKDLPVSLMTFKNSRQRHYESLISTSYGLPHRALGEAMGSHDLPFPEAAVTIACLADFALNPPLPPYVAYDDANRPDWDSIYPPIRFLRACEAVRSLGFLSHEPSDSDLRGFFGSVSSLTGLANPSDYSNGVFFDRSFPETQTFNFASNIVGELEGDYISLLAWAQRKLWSLRVNHPGMIALYGQNWVPSDDPDERRAKLELRIEGSGWFEPPFWRIDRGSIAHTKMVSDATAAQYMMSLSFYLNLYDLACRAEAFDATNLSVPALDERTAEGKNVISRLMGVDVWED